MKIGWYTKITRVEISTLLIFLRSVSQVKQRVSLRLAHMVVKVPWLWADSFPARTVLAEEFTAHKLAPAATEKHVCIWVAKNESSKLKRSKQKFSHNWCCLDWNRLGSAQKQLSWPVWLPGGHCSPWGMETVTVPASAVQSGKGPTSSVWVFTPSHCTWCTDSSGRRAYSQSAWVALLLS